MARQLHRLTAKKVETIKKPGYHADGGNLVLQVTETKAKSWIFRYALHGKQHEVGLGSLNAVGLKQARDKAAECRSMLANGKNPKEERRAQRIQDSLEKANTISYRECWQRYIAAHRAGWKNEKHVEQWSSTLETYCGPVIGALPVSEVDTPLVLRVLEPIWTEKNETATRLRGRIERVLDWARVRGYRQGENPARWRGHLDKLLASISRRQRIQHHPALPYASMVGFMGELAKQEGIAAAALRFTILTAARTGEVIGAKWREIDFDAKVWIVPASRMKSKREHRIPLTDAAISAIEKLPRDGEYVFPGARADKPLSNMAMAKLLERMGRDDITVHGFRSSFRDWAAEQTNYPREVCEMALAHVIGNQVEAAYRRGDLFEKRRLLMTDWASWCLTPRGKLLPLTKRRAAR